MTASGRFSLPVTLRELSPSGENRGEPGRTRRGLALSYRSARPRPQPGCHSLSSWGSSDSELAPLGGRLHTGWNPPSFGFLT